MNAKNLAFPILLLFGLYVGFGSGLPGPLGQGSTAVRTGISNYFSDLFSGFSSFEPNRRTREATEQLEKK